MTYLLITIAHPIQIKDKEDFYNVLVEAFTKASEDYHTEYKKIVNSERTVQGILDV